MGYENISLSAPPRNEMTTEQLARQNKLVTQAVARLEAQRDGRTDEYGLIKRERLDDSGRKIREWDSVDGKMHWMEPFKQHVCHEQIRINNRETSPEENQEYLAQWMSVHKRG